MEQRSNIRDVAELSGYSIATVSMVLNNKKVKISNETKIKVLNAAKELGYRPNKLARSLITKKTMVLGLIIPFNTNLVFAALSRVIEEEARRLGYAIIYGNTGDRSEEDAEYIDMFLDHQVDGIIMIPSTTYDPLEAEKIKQRIDSLTIPIVALDRRPYGCDIHTVQMNHFKSGYIATKYLLSKGHRRISYSIDLGYIASRAQRFEGYQAALEEAGLKFDESLIYEVDKNDISDELFSKLISQKSTALLAINDSMAIEIYRKANKLGINIPKDLSVIGFDDLMFADMLTPPLTSLRPPVKKIGSEAVHILIDLIQNSEKGLTEPESDKMHQFSPEIIIRESVCEIKPV